MNIVLIIFYVLIKNATFAIKHLKFPIDTYGLSELRAEYGGDLTSASFEIIQGLATNAISIGYDNHTNINFIHLLLQTFLKNKISVRHFNLTSIENQEKFFDFLGYQVENHLDTCTIFFCTHKLYEHILLEIYEKDFIRRNFVYIFNWGRRPFHEYFLKNIYYIAKVYVITNPRTDTFRLYYNQASVSSTTEHHLEMINWWHHGVGLFNHPTLPAKYSNVAYKDFKGKVFNVPVIHKPPWHFVRYINDTAEVLGGRDDRILSLLSKKLNFKYQYFDPPERIQGSVVPENGTFTGVLGLIWRRQAELFIGDVALTLERSNYVEFSFITLADSGAFITHAPSKLNEALALLRPFQWQVWPAIGLTFMVVGPVLYAIVALPNTWQPRFRVRSHARLLFDCTWFTVTILLKQTGREPSSSYKARFFIILLSFSVTYVINDMYSANLTSLLARPGREKAINNLEQLEKAMLVRGYNLYVEGHSSSYSLLENGTGIYNRLWEMMNKKQTDFSLESVEDLVKLVRDTTNTAVIAGRETLFFDIQRFGPSNFHLSEKLNTAYSAIAFQLGCPYIAEVNQILMAIFEAGIITKMTENEYEKLGKQKEISAEIETNVIPGAKKENRRTVKASEDNEKLQPISIKMLQGTFYLLSIGSLFSGLILVAEIVFYKHRKTGYGNARKMRFIVLRKFRRFIAWKIGKIVGRLKRVFWNFMNDARVATLEYIE